jgi:hypothetical protein
VPNILTLTVEQTDEILNTGAYGAGAVMRVQAATTEDGVYADVSGTGSTPTVAIVAGTRSYAGYDPAGTSSTWYRTRLENVGGTRLSVDWTGDALWAEKPGHAPFQVAPEGSGLICSLWDVKQALGITDTSEDEDLIERIRQVGDEIHQMTGRLFVRTPASGVDTFLFDVDRHGHRTRTLRVPKGIAALTTVELATTSQPGTGGTYATVASADWMLRPLEGDRTVGWPATRLELSDYSGTYFYGGHNVVRLTGALGFETVPYSVQGIAQRAVIGSFLSKASAGVSAAIGPTGATTILRHISPADHESLMRFAVLLG